MSDQESRGESAHRAVTESRFLTLADVATYLNISVSQVYALVRSGELPAIKIGGRGIWRVDRERLDAYIDRLHERTSAATKEHLPTPPKRARPQ
ncbi:MAG: helix-turn-helix domain-containing protein [Actinomycetota bacterium]